MVDAVGQAALETPRVRSSLLGWHNSLGMLALEPRDFCDRELAPTRKRRPDGGGEAPGVEPLRRLQVASRTVETKFYVEPVPYCAT